jgi:glycosyltransferase involved in cell wall biosynthesis
MANGVQLLLVDDIKLKPNATDRFRQIAYRCIGERYLFEREPALLKSMARRIEKKLDGEDLDIVFSASSLPVAYLETDHPIVVWTDSTFGGLLDLYEHFTGVCARSLHNGHLSERLSMLNAELSIYSSKWASEIAEQMYRIDSDRIATIPLGANLTDVPSRKSVQANDRLNGTDTLKLLFVGYDWERKGGADALRVHQRIVASGIRSELTIVGCSPSDAKDMKGVHVIGRLDKKQPEQLKRFEELMMESHFLLLPSTADCTAIVFSEAAAFGMPVITTDVGGHASIISNGQNGYLFPPDDPCDGMVETITSVWQDQDRYQRMCLKARDVFEQKLSWSANTKNLISRLQLIVESNKMPLRRAV